MGKKSRSRREEQQVDPPLGLRVISKYIEAYASRDSKRMDSLRSPDFVLDFVHVDAFEGEPLSAEDASEFWPIWFAAFPDLDYQVTRTIAAERVIVTQWLFTGTHSGPLGPPVFDRHVGPTDRTIQFRGLSIYDLAGGLIQRETLYLDFATVLVELGVEF